MSITEEERMLWQQLCRAMAATDTSKEVRGSKSLQLTLKNGRRIRWTSRRYLRSNSLTQKNRKSWYPMGHIGNCLTRFINLNEAFDWLVMARVRQPKFYR